MQVTRNDVAKKCGISSATVSRVINNSAYVSEEIRRKVIEAVAELGYSPNEAAQQLRCSRIDRDERFQRNTYNVGCIICAEQKLYSKFSHPYFSLVLAGIDEEAARQGYRLTAYTAEELDSNLSLAGKINRNNLDGIITIGGFNPIEKRVFDRARERLGAAVCIDCGYIPENADFIDVDKEQAGYEAVKYLAAAGHRRIGFAGNSRTEQMVADKRFKGYCQALREFNLDYDRNIIVGEEHGFEPGYACMKKMLESGNALPTAVFAGSDMTAIGVIKAIKEKGLNVPGDISIIGYDDIDIARFSTPPLTTIKGKQKELGKLAFRRVIEKAGNPGLKTAKILVNTELVIRESVSSPRVGEYAPIQYRCSRVSKVYDY
jgi:LacI family transcriptional regulator